MPTYEYLCHGCRRELEAHQRMSDPPLVSCPHCGGTVERLVSGGVAVHTGGHEHHDGQACSLETTGRTCCGATERCGAPCDHE